MESPRPAELNPRFLAWLLPRKEAAGDTHADLADAIGVSRQHVTDILRGSRIPTRRLIASIAEHYGEGPDYPTLTCGFAPPILEDIDEDDWAFLVKALAFRRESHPADISILTAPETAEV
jgi:transcriptional regulator with XRE-family HTH domain